MTAPVVVFAIGNPSRGDDALGPVLCGQLEKWLENEKLADGFELIEDFQLQIEHALDLVGRELALFIDAGANTRAPFIFEQILPSTAMTHTTHALSPSAVLQVYLQTEGQAPPPAYVLCVRGENFELGEPLSPAANAHATEALALLKALCRPGETVDWPERAQALTGELPASTLSA